MAEISPELVHTAEYLHSRADLHVIGPFSLPWAGWNEKNQWNFMIAPIQPLDLETLNSLEAELGDKLSPTVKGKTQPQNIGLGFTHLGKLIWRDEIHHKPAPSYQAYTSFVTRGEVIVFPNQRLLSLAELGMSAGTLLRLVGGFYDVVSYFRENTMDFLSLVTYREVPWEVTTSLFNGQIDPKEIEGMIREYVLVNVIDGYERQQFIPDVNRFIDYSHRLAQTR